LTRLICFDSPARSRVRSWLREPDLPAVPAAARGQAQRCWRLGRGRRAECRRRRRSASRRYPQCRVAVPAPPRSAAIRDQLQVSARPRVPPKPRKRSRRSCPPDGNVAAKRSTWAAESSLTEKRRLAHALELVGPNVAAPTALAQRTREPSALHS